MFLFTIKHSFSFLPSFKGHAASLHDILPSLEWIYIDKTKHIAEIMLDPTDLMFFNRPRRFGKSMILQGLEYFINTRATQAEFTKRRSLQIFSSNLFGENSSRNAIWSTFKSQLHSKNYVAITLDFSKLKWLTAMGQFREGLFDILIGSIDKCIIKYEPYLTVAIKENFEKAMKASTIEKVLEILANGKLNLILLIDEYEAPLMYCLDPRFCKYYDVIEAQYNSFFSNIKAAKANGLTKCVMTGVICLRSVSAFSDANSFTNLSLDEKYRETFGFTMKEVEEHENVKKLLDHLLSSRRVPPEVARMSQEERRKHFIDAMFQVYNGFRFTPDSVKENISLISPISMVNHIENIMKDSNADPYDFDQHWSNTGQTSMIKALAINNVDPTESYEILVKAKKEALDLRVLKKAYSLHQKLIPLNLLLFNTGYFTLKKVSNSIAELDWTNKETKEAFYENYVNGLGFKVNDLLNPLKNKTNWDMKLFVDKLNSYFTEMVKKHYESNQKNDHEQNQTLNLFLELLEYMQRNPMSKCQTQNTVIYHQYRLAQDLKDLNLGKVPDLLFVFSDDKEETKQFIFMEFYKWYIYFILLLYFLEVLISKKEENTDEDRT